MRFSITSMIGVALLFAAASMQTKQAPAPTTTTDLVGIDVTRHGIIPGNSGIKNRTALLELLKSLGSQGGRLHWPAGRYAIAPLSSQVVRDATWTRYVSWAGDGVKSTWIELSEPADFLLNFSGLYCFDCAFSDLTFSGAGKSKIAVVQFDNGGRHYRVSLTDIGFRDSQGDGLVIKDSALFYSRGAGAYLNAGWGFRFSSVLSFYGDLDVEFNKAGGVLFDVGTTRRITANTVVTGLYSEDLSPVLQIDGMSGVHVLNMNRAHLVLKGGASGSVICGNELTAHIEDAWGNDIRGYCNVVTGPAKHANQVVQVGQNFRSVPDAALPPTIRQAVPKGAGGADAYFKLDLNKSNGYAQVSLRRTGGCRVFYRLVDESIYPGGRSLWNPSTRQWEELKREGGQHVEVLLNEGTLETVYLPIPGPENRARCEIKLDVIGQNDPAQRVDVYEFRVL